ncbi:MAG: T9SS type A sorting domain-containing protein [Melioribacteraceae bacterium]
MYVKKIIFILFLFAGFLSGEGKISGTSSKSAPANSLFGYAVSVYGEFSAVSAPYETYDNITSSGAIYIYKLKESKWKFFQKITPSDPSPMKLFGVALKMVGNTLLVGAPNDNIKSGSAYVFKYNGELWIEEKKITPKNPIMFQCFGTALDLIPGFAIISSVSSENNNAASGTVYIYRITSKEWIEEAKIISSVNDDNDLFGESLAIVSPDQFIVGSPRSSAFIENGGALFCFRNTSSGWKSLQTLNSAYPRKEGLFGCSMSYSKNKLIVGAMQEIVDSSNSGAAYIYNINEQGEWQFEKRLTPENQKKQDYFGMAVSLEEDIAIVGSPKWDKGKLKTNNDMGCANVFSNSDSGWVSIGRIVPEDGREDDHFGMAISSFGSNLFIGSRLDDVDAINNGSAYSFNLMEQFPSLRLKYIPASFELYNNYPNPFNPVTTIRYDLPVTSRVNITVYDILGRKIIELINSEMEAGKQQVVWNGKNSYGSEVASGIYLYRLTTSKFSNVKKMILIK